MSASTSRENNDQEREVIEADDTATQRDVFASDLFGKVLAAMEVATVYVGDRLGLYEALAEGGWKTSSELAAITGTNERYLREWLEQQAVVGVLHVDYLGPDAGSRRYRLPASHTEVLLGRDSLQYLAPMARFTVGILSPIQQLLQAFKSGAGVPYAAYGADAREGQADANRPIFINLLAKVWLPAIPDVHERLLNSPSARVADIGCGTGWSSIAMARAYPQITVDGYDLDEPSIAIARSSAAEAGVSDRVRFHVHDASDSALIGQYDLVTAFECIHDMGRPVDALTVMRGLAVKGGAVIVADERVDETFSAPGDEIERLMYGWSVLFCQPTSLADSPSMGTGTVMRPDVLRTYAGQAGFRDVEVLPIEHDFWRLYRLIV